MSAGASAPYPYPDAYNPDLLERIPLWSRRVLDIGCGTGVLGARFKQRNPAAQVIGIETDAGAAARAKTRLDQVFVGDIEALSFPDALKGTFDCLIYGDVLEHLRDPWALLRRHAALLAPQGVLLACVPNVEHWSFVARLLQGRWAYEETGLFDRTHLRWFSAETLRRALTEAGLVPLDSAPRVFEPEKGQRFILAITPALQALGVTPEEYARRALPLQYIWRARPSPPERLTVFSTMLKPVGGVSHVRVIEPMRGLATDPEIRAGLADLRTLAAQAPEGPSIVILHRPALIGEGGLASLRPLIQKGYLLVCEFDDHPDYIPVLQQRPMYNFSAVHAIQTTTPVLAEVLRAANPEVAVFPNAVSELREPVNFADPSRLTLFFAGINREADWPALLPALNRVAAEAGPRLQVKVLHDRGFFAALATPHKSFSPMLDYPDYLAALAQAEISFMPLQDTLFNRCKSDLKFIEAAAAGVAALASDTVYAGSIADGETGMVFRNPQELEMKLRAMLADPAMTQSLALRARAEVARARMLASQILPRIAWYRDLWQRRESLHAALLARVPELAMPPPGL